MSSLLAFTWWRRPMGSNRELFITRLETAFLLAFSLFTVILLSCETSKHNWEHELEGPWAHRWNWRMPRWGRRHGFAGAFHRKAGLRYTAPTLERKYLVSQNAPSGVNVYQEALTGDLNKGAFHFSWKPLSWERACKICNHKRCDNRLD